MTTITRAQVQIFLLAVGIAICLLLAIMCQLIDYQSKYRKRQIIMMETATALLLLADLCTYIYRDSTSLECYWITRISNFLDFFLIYIELILLTKFLCSYVRKSETFADKVLKVVHILSYIGMAMLVVSQFTGLYYSFDENNNYVRGPLFVGSFVLPFVIFMIMLHMVMTHRDSFSKQIQASAVIITILPLVCAIIQGFIYGISVFNLSIAIGAISIFALSLGDQNEYLRRMARIEKMTGLPNSHGFLMEIKERMENKTIANYNAMYFDVVRMGLVNRKFGNQIGDYVIIEYAKYIREHMEEDEVLGRLGGNYFVAIVKKENTEKYLDMLRGITIPIHLGNRDDEVTLSAVTGIYEMLGNEVAASQIMTNVSMAVSIAKNVKKKPYVYLTKELVQEMNEQRQMQELIPQGIAKKEFVAFYQPKVSLKDNSLCGGEALARWIHNGELIPPYRFIPLMEQNESICGFDFYILNRVCADIKEWIARGITPPRISVNFSRKNLGNPILAEAIYNVVKSYDIPIELIQIEITETVDEYPIEYLKGVVEALQRYGMTAAIDDFGTGSSSIKIFKEVPFDVLKIDKSFIDSISDTDKHILAHIVGMAEDMGADIVSEGVETREQMEVIKELGCSVIQGYFFDKPLEKSEFEERILSPEYSLTE